MSAISSHKKRVLHLVFLIGIQVILFSSVVSLAALLLAKLNTPKRPRQSANTWRASRLRHQDTRNYIYHRRQQGNEKKVQTIADEIDIRTIRARIGIDKQVQQTFRGRRR